MLENQRSAALLSEDQLTRSLDVLNGCLAKNIGLYSVIISSVDGNAICHAGGRNLPNGRLATINSSMLAVAETMARESAQKTCRFVLVENTDGRIVSLRINDKLLLTCIANTDSNLGMLLSLGQQTTNQLAELLR